ncbi:MAG TPA: hypothetical protein EYP30_07605 [Archaeoglobaceae archaeon]|nr:hypothetical protein [Archaeoglobaceae archaeon]
MDEFSYINSIAWTIKTKKYCIVCSEIADLKMKEFNEIADDIQNKFGCEMMAKGSIRKYGRKIIIEELILPEKVMAVKKLGKLGLYDSRRKRVCGSGVYGSHEFYEWSDDWDVATGSFRIFESSRYLERTKNCNFVIHSHLSSHLPSKEDYKYCLSNNMEFSGIRNKGKTYLYMISGKDEISGNEKKGYSLICTF